MSKLPLVSVYKSPRKDEMYLYVSKAEGLKRVPEALLEQFGKPKHVFDLLLKPERELARADVGKVLAELAERGFYLQLPPVKDEYLLNLFQPDDSKHQQWGE